MSLSKPNIVFIEPKAPNPHVFSHCTIPRLGNVLLATMARRRGWEAQAIVEEMTPISLVNLPNADIVALSSITSTSMRAYEIADVYRRRSVPVLLGGPHVTFMPDEAAERGDWVIRGEGEIPFAAFMEAFERGGGYGSVPGLTFKQGDETVHNPMPSCSVDLADLPFPDLDLIRGYSRVMRKYNVPFETSRGCPHQCNFCNVSRMFGRRMRYRPIESTIEELRKYQGLRRPIFVVDDNFAANPERAKKLLRAVAEAGLKIRWSAQVRADCTRDNELLELMERTNCASVSIGIETINPRTLANIKKMQSAEGVAEAIGKFHDHGIRVHGMFILGFDEDGSSVARETVRFAKHVKLNTAQFLVLTPLPGTQMFDELQRDRRILTEDWSLYDAHHVVYRPMSILPFELQRLQLKAHRKFYNIVQQAKRLLRFEFLELYVALYASYLTKHWKRLNRLFMRWLKRLSQAIGRGDSMDLGRGGI